MNPLFVITAVRAVIRIGRTAQDTFEQYAQEKPIFLPDAEDLPDDPVGEIITIAQDYPAFQKLLEEDGELKKLWSDSTIGHAGLLLVLFTASRDVADHDLLMWHKRCLDRGYPVGTPSVRGFAINDRIGNAWCAVAVFNVRNR